jgi:hypothetical protein
VVSHFLGENLLGENARLAATAYDPRDSPA